MIDGKPLIQKISDQLTPFFNEVIISANNHDIYKFMNLKIIRDEEQNCGPLMGIYSTLLHSNDRLNFIVACDNPTIKISIVNKMVNMAEHCDIVVPVYENAKCEPLFAVYNKAVVPFIRDALSHGNRRITELLSNVNVKYFHLDSQDEIINLNTKEDLLRWQSEKQTINQEFS